MHRTDSLNSGHHAARAAAKRWARATPCDAAMRATGDQAHCRETRPVASRCLDAVSGDVLAGALDRFAVETPRRSPRRRGSASAPRDARTCASSRKAATAARHRHRLRLPLRRFERNDDVLYICYDNEAYIDTGVQRSSATPPAREPPRHRRSARCPATSSAPAENLPRIGMPCTASLRRDRGVCQPARPRAQGDLRHGHRGRALSTSSSPVRSAGTRAQRHDQDRAAGRRDPALPLFEAHDGGLREDTDSTQAAGDRLPGVAKALCPPFRQLADIARIALTRKSSTATSPNTG